MWRGKITDAGEWRINANTKMGKICFHFVVFLQFVSPAGEHTDLRMGVDTLRVIVSRFL